MLSVLAETPALPLHTAGKYVAAAYVVLFALVLLYVGIMAVRMSRVERNLGELLAEAERAKSAAGARGPDVAAGAALDVGAGATADGRAAGLDDAAAVASGNAGAQAGGAPPR